MLRATTFGVMLLRLIAAFISGVVVLSVGYWVSDLVYAAGLWPVGAVMRICLILFFVGWALSIIGLALATLASPFAVGPED